MNKHWIRDNKFFSFLREGQWCGSTDPRLNKINDNIIKNNDFSFFYLCVRITRDGFPQNTLQKYEFLCVFSSLFSASFAFYFFMFFFFEFVLKINRYCFSLIWSFGVWTKRFCHRWCHRIPLSAQLLDGFWPSCHGTKQNALWIMAPSLGS